MVSTYNKPFLDVHGQLERLIELGLVVDDSEQAYRELQAIGYYRLSGYWYPFRRHAEESDASRPSEFVPGATLAEVLDIYRFDERLRAEVLYALSHVEVAMRFRVGHLLGRRGPFTHLGAATLDQGWVQPQKRASSGPNCSAGCDWQESEHEQWMRKQERNEDISNEAFTAHFHSRYGKPLPVWTATEVMSLGDLNRLFGGLTQRDRQQIAVDFDLYLEDGNGDAGALSSWLEHLRQTRNYCAHHARLWNRNHTAPLSVPTGLPEMTHLRGADIKGTGAKTVSRPASRLYGTLVVISYFLARINNSNDVRDRLRVLIDEFAVGKPERLTAMGFPEGWEQEAVWQQGYKRDDNLARQASMLRDVDLLYTSDASALLTHKHTFKEQKGRLGYYRKRGAALSVPGTEAHRYPGFQFDAKVGDLFPLAIIANRRLLNGGATTDDGKWAALKWWTSPQPALPHGVSPQRALVEGSLTRELLDALLEPCNEEE